MTLQEFYDAIGGDYKGVMSRLMKEERVVKYVRKFLNDASFETLNAKLDEGDYEEAFRAAHTLKGVTQNLSFTKLYQSSHEMTEALRNKETGRAEELLARVELDYAQTYAAVKSFQDGT